MIETEFCTEEEISHLVRTFYAKVRRDEALGPIFNEHVDNWDMHLAKLEDFWSSALLHTRRFKGGPMPKHVVLPDLNADLFRRWLALFQETTATLPNRAMAERADAMAKRIAQSLWYGYQIHNCPDTLPSELDRH